MVLEHIFTILTTILHYSAGHANVRVGLLTFSTDKYTVTLIIKFNKLYANLNPPKVDSPLLAAVLLLQPLQIKEVGPVFQLRDLKDGDFLDHFLQTN